MKATEAYNKSVEAIAGDTGAYRRIVDEAIAYNVSIGRFEISDVLTNLRSAGRLATIGSIEITLLAKDLEKDGFKVKAHSPSDQRDSEYLSVSWGHAEEILKEKPKYHAFNLNALVKVNLTSRGVEVYAHSTADHTIVGQEIVCTLWRLMQVFGGNCIGNGVDTPFLDNLVEIKNVA